MTDDPIPTASDLSLIEAEMKALKDACLKHEIPLILGVRGTDDTISVIAGPPHLLAILIEDMFRRAGDGMLLRLALHAMAEINADMHGLLRSMTEAEEAEDSIGDPAGRMN